MKIVQTKLLILLLTVLSAFPLSCYTQNENSIYIATWNLENLFDTIDDPEKRDEEFLPGGKKEWTEKRLESKIENLTKVIEYMNDGKGPDLLGVQEVEHQRLLNRLICNFSIDKKYKIAYAESPDKRGIDNGLFYNSEMFNLIDVNDIQINLPSNYPTRGILQAKLSYLDADTLIVYVNHWPSRSGGQERSEPNRIEAAQALRTIIDSLFTMNNNSNIIILGDFNDEPGDISLAGTLGAKNLICDSTEIGTSELFNIAYKHFNDDLGTYLFRGDWNMLDNIILSSSLVSGDLFSYECNSSAIVKTEFMITEEGNYKGAAIPTFGGSKYLGGFSDHYPFSVKIRVLKN